MNNARRKAIGDAITGINAAKTALENIKAEIENSRDEEQDYYDTMPGTIREGEKGDTAQEAVCELDWAIDELDEMIGQVDQIVEHLVSACGG